MDVRSPTSSKDLISSRLRKKTPKSSDKSSLPQGMTPVSKLKESDIKEEFPVAIVKGGKFVLGEVKSISPGINHSMSCKSIPFLGHPIRYTILFEDDSEEIVSWALLR